MSQGKKTLSVIGATLVGLVGGLSAAATILWGNIDTEEHQTTKVEYIERRASGYTLNNRQIYDKPALLLRVEVEQKIYNQAQTGRGYLLVSILVLGLILSGVTLLVINRLVLSRVARLSASLSAISNQGDISARLSISGNDELSCLADKINQILTALEDSQRRRQEVELALRQTEEKYRQIFDNATQGIYQSNSDGRYISANNALAKLYGYQHPEQLIANITDIGKQVYVEPSRYAKLLSSMHKYDTVSRFVSQIYRADGSTIWISENARAVCDSEGNLLYYEGTVEDVTDRKVVAEALHYQQEQSERLLLNILPGPIAARLKLEENTIADNFAEVTVLFADLVGFTQICAEIPPTKLVSLLNEIFSTFDCLAERHGLEKIKTIGDAYMVAGGLPLPQSNHAAAVAEMALDMLSAIAQFKTKHGIAFNIRIGINTGPVVAGVIGIKRLIYDLWGDTVNIASRMESQGIPGCIQVTKATYEQLQHQYIFEQRGAIEVKGKGEMMTYLLITRKNVPLLASQILEQETHPV